MGILIRHDTGLRAGDVRLIVQEDSVTEASYFTEAGLEWIKDYINRYNLKLCCEIFDSRKR